MPKVSISKLLSIRRWIESYNRSGEVFKIMNNNTVFCQYCQKIVTVDKKFQIDQHTKSFIHVKYSKSSTFEPTFVNESSSNEDRSQFFKELCFALVSSNIPLHKLQNNNFKTLLEKYTNRHIPDESALRENYLSTCYNDVLRQIRDDIGNSYIFFCVDETTDPGGRYVANFVIGKLNVDSPPKPYLLTSKVLDKTNSSTVARFVNDSIKLLWPEGNNDDKVLLMLSYATPYMTKAANNLKPFYSNLVHVTCVAHDVHRIAEKILDNFRGVDDLIRSGNTVFFKTPYRIQLFNGMFPNRPLPPQPTDTQWSTWLETALFYADNFEEYKCFIQSLQEDRSKSITNCKLILNEPNVKSDLAYIRANFSIIIESVKKLETSNLSLTKALEIVEKVESSINVLPKDETGAVIKKQCVDTINENTGLKLLKDISKIIQGESVNLNDFSLQNCSPEIFANFKYAPITNVNVERRFSSYKYILTNRRYDFSKGNMENTIVTYCFSN